VTGGASAPQPSSSTFSSLLDRAATVGLARLDVVGVKTGLVFTGGGGALEPVFSELPAEYLAPEASATFRMMESTSRSLSERAVIWTW
jgi:hypothetical protein